MQEGVSREMEEEGKNDSEWKLVGDKSTAVQDK